MWLSSIKGKDPIQKHTKIRNKNPSSNLKKVCPRIINTPGLEDWSLKTKFSRGKMPSFRNISLSSKRNTNSKKLSTLKLEKKMNTINTREGRVLRKHK